MVRSKYFSEVEELIIKESLKQISQGETTEVDMSDDNQVRKYFGVVGLGGHSGKRKVYR